MDGNIYLFLSLGFSAESLSVQMCKEMVNELWQTIHKATGFYNKVIYQFIPLSGITYII